MEALRLKVVWKFAMLESGDQCVTVAGAIRMLLLYVCNLDFKEQVESSNYYRVIIMYKFSRCNCS